MTLSSSPSGAPQAPTTPSRAAGVIKNVAALSAVVAALAATAGCEGRFPTKAERETELATGLEPLKEKDKKHDEALTKSQEADVKHDDRLAKLEARVKELEEKGASDEELAQVKQEIRYVAIRVKSENTAKSTKDAEQDQQLAAQGGEITKLNEFKDGQRKYDTINNERVDVALQRGKIGMDQAAIARKEAAAADAKADQALITASQAWKQSQENNR